MSNLIRILLAACLIAALHPAALRAQAEERTLHAGVLTEAGAPALGLSGQDFTVREDGAAREVLRAGPATGPLRIALLVDTSQAIDSYVLDLRQGVSAFLEEMQGKAEIAVITFGERPTVVADYTRDASRLQAAVGRLFTARGSGAYLLDAVIETSRGLEKRSSARPIIVAIIGNGPEFSERSHEMVLDGLARSGAAFYALAVNRRAVRYDDSSTQELELALSRGTTLTGGKRDDLLTSMVLGDRLRAVAAELNNQYEVVYSRTRTLLPPKTVEVEVKRPGLAVHARRVP